MHGKKDGHSSYMDETEDHLEERDYPAQKLGKDGHSRYTQETNKSLGSARGVARGVEGDRGDDMPDYMKSPYHGMAEPDMGDMRRKKPQFSDPDIAEGASMIERMTGDPDHY